MIPQAHGAVQVEVLRRVPLPFLLLLLLLPGAGCRAEATRSESLSPEAVTLDLPLVKQDELHACGLASLSSLCRYWGIEIDSQKSASLSRLALERKGLSGGELREALESLGLEVLIFRGTLDRASTGLYHQIDEGRPAIVMLSGGGDARHYCLVVGYDEPRRNLLLLDPVRGEVLRSTASFERAWEECQRFTLLSFPKETAKKGAGGAQARFQ